MNGTKYKANLKKQIGKIHNNFMIEDLPDAHPAVLMKEKASHVLRDPNSTESQKREAQQQIQSYFAEELDKMPNLFTADSGEDGGDPRYISDEYNPLLPGNADKPEFYEDLYKVFKMSRAQDGTNYHATRFIAGDGGFRPDFGAVEFEEFKKKIMGFSQKHGK